MGHLSQFCSVPGRHNDAYAFSVRHHRSLCERESFSRRSKEAYSLSLSLKFICSEILFFIRHRNQPNSNRRIVVPEMPCCVDRRGPLLLLHT